MTEKELMLTGEPFIPEDEELGRDFLRGRKITRIFNNTTEEQYEYRVQLIKELLKKTGEKVWIEPPFHCDYGCNISVGENFYANYDCLILDINEINIGNNVLLGPRVSMYATSHPIDAEVRNMKIECAKSINIGDNVWIGGSVVINPGVSIGKNSIIGSGSIVTKDIPENVIAAGNPCKVIRKITDEDKKYWNEQKERYYRLKNLEDKK